MPRTIDPFADLKPPRSNNEGLLVQLARASMDSEERLLTVKELAAKEAEEKAAAKRAAEAEAKIAEAAAKKRALGEADREDALAEDQVNEKRILKATKGVWCKMARKRLRAHGVSEEDIEFYILTMAGVLIEKRDYEKAAAILEDVVAQHGERKDAPS